MGNGILHLIRTTAMAAIALLGALGVGAANVHNVLVITSYNPDTQKMYATLSDFNDKLNSLDKDSIKVTIESMNCSNLSEAYEWRGRMTEILGHYTKMPPSLIILLGPEAWTAYLSQTTDFAKETPCMAALVSTNTVLLPKDTVNLRTWHPQSLEYTDIKDFNIVGGIFYKYDIEKSLDLVRRYYPKTKNIALITDFTFGGVTMQANVIAHMRRHKDIGLTLLDGRHNTLYEMCYKLHRMKKDNVLWIGTWRIDSSENYVLGNTVDALHSANTALPAFALSSVGMGNWAIGGYCPQYTLQGERLARMAYSYINGKDKDRNLFVTMPNKYTLDEKQLYAFKLDHIDEPADALLINTKADFFSQHKELVLWIAIVLAVLVLSLLFAIYDAVRTRRYKDRLLQKSKELLAAKEEAEKANSIKTSFIANMSHEIRTPLNAIVGFTDLIIQDDYDKEDKKQFNAIINENSQLLLNLINEILDISRIESGHITIAREECDVTQLCHGALESVKQASKLKNVEFREELPEREIIIATDPTRLMQVITNLLSNAGKFTKQGHITLALHVDEKAKQLLFEVRDTGIGIPKDKAKYIFERFAKLNQYVQGTGLGLSLCKIIVHCLGGKIWLDTEYTGGACFKFTHPYSTEAEKASSETAQKM